MSDDYYKILGVDKNASKDDIKKAYKQLAKKYHPDLNKDNPQAENTFKQLNEAANVLLDDQKRANYDRFGKAGAQQHHYQQNGSGFEGFSDFSDFGGFGDIFEGFEQMFGATNSRQSSRSRRGSDLLYELSITLEEAAFGIKKTVKIPKTIHCPDCQGKGYKRDSDVKTCHDCHGTGRQTRVQKTPFGMFQTQTVCSACGGRGQVIVNACSTCNGSGKVQHTATIDVEVPAGIENGQRLRLKGQGEAGTVSGDLYVEISIKPHDIFEREENDIHCTASISFVQAALGDEIEVPTLKGKAKLTIPPGTQGGTLFKMSGKGIPQLQGFGAGHQYVKVEIDVPMKLSQKQKELLIEFDKQSGNTKKKKSFVDKIKESL